MADDGDHVISDNNTLDGVNLIDGANQELETSTLQMLQKKRRVVRAKTLVVDDELEEVADLKLAWW